MAIRYCGRMKIDCKLIPAKHMPHGEQYKCDLSIGSQSLGIQYVGLPAHLTEAIDSPKAYDDAARAALSFAVDDDTIDENSLSFNEDGSYVILRSLGDSKHRWLRRQG